MTAYIPILLLGCFLIAGLALLQAARMIYKLPAADHAPAPSKVPVPIPLVQSGISPQASDLHRQLAMAGFTHPDAARRFYAIKLGAALAGLAAGLLALHITPSLATLSDPMRLLVPLLGFAPGFYLPSMVVDRRAAAYRKRIETALPDALDFMLICVEAGQSADVAMMRTADELAPVHPDLAARFAALTEALAAGAERVDAYQRLAQDSGNEDLRQFGAIIVQSSSMGTPVAQTLRVFSADLRDRRIRQVEERANVLPTKMTLGTMIFTIPPLLILLLAPALFRIMQSF